MHIPVMLSPILEHLSPVLREKISPSYFDGTFGRGGHLKAVFSHFPSVRAVAMDQDPEAVAYAHKEFSEDIQSGRLQIFHANFSEFTMEKFGQFDAMMVDLGVSSPQLDQAQRGFSFYHEGPLDMRMNTDKGFTASQFLAEASEEELIWVFKTYGEIRNPFYVARTIVSDRKKKPFLTTRQLASLIEKIDGWRKKGFHPATQYFMALRLHVNDELRVVEESLVPLIYGLKSRGRLSVLTFHSLEDRIVKGVFKTHADLGAPLFKKVIKPEWEEKKVNPRSRSAKLRIFERSP